MDQLDERDKQAFLELQEKLVDQTKKKKQVAAQLRSCDTEQKRAVLTAEELNNLPDDAKTYEQIGRAYFLMPKLQLLQDRKDTAMTNLREHMDIRPTALASDFHHMTDLQANSCAESD
ncbi:hypothetical protein WJX79_005884 [Trebouxia sp. C0005]